MILYEDNDDLTPKAFEIFCNLLKVGGSVSVVCRQFNYPIVTRYVC